MELCNVGILLVCKLPLVDICFFKKKQICLKQICDRHYLNGVWTKFMSFYKHNKVYILSEKVRTLLSHIISEGQKGNRLGLSRSLFSNYASYFQPTYMRDLCQFFTNIFLPNLYARFLSPHPERNGEFLYPYCPGEALSWISGEN